MRYLIGAVVLFALWLLISGVYKPLTIGLGVASTLFAIWISARMNRVDGQPNDIRINDFRVLQYFFGYLMVEIAKSNWAVTKLILSLRKDPQSNYVVVPHGQKTDLGETIFANSITLTPGTLTVETSVDAFRVHVLDYQESDMDALADMNARVCEVEAV
ncbi:MAG: Na+/H+ antiporter subunit E [Pseudomonadota bacterium]